MSATHGAVESTEGLREKVQEDSTEEEDSNNMGESATFGVRKRVKSGEQSRQCGLDEDTCRLRSNSESIKYRLRNNSGLSTKKSNVYSGDTKDTKINKLHKAHLAESRSLKSFLNLAQPKEDGLGNDNASKEVLEEIMSQCMRALAKLPQSVSLHRIRGKKNYY